MCRRRKRIEGENGGGGEGEGGGGGAYRDRDFADIHDVFGREFLVVGEHPRLEGALVDERCLQAEPDKRGAKHARVARGQRWWADKGRHQGETLGAMTTTAALFER